MAKKPPLGDEVWQEIEVRWCAGESNNSLAKAFGISRQSIIERARLKGWGRDPHGEVAQVTDEILHGASSGTEEGRRKLIEAVGAGRAALIRRHQQEWVGLVKLRDDAIRIAQGLPTKFIKPDEVFKDENGKPVDENGKPIRDTLDRRVTLSNKVLNLYEKAVSATMNAHEGERRSHGFDYKMQAEGEKNVDPEGARARHEKMQYLKRLRQEEAAARLAEGSAVVPQEGAVIEGEVL